MSSDNRIFLHELAREHDIDEVTFPPPSLEYLIARKIVHVNPEVLCLDIVTPYFSFEYSSIDDLIMIANNLEEVSCEK